MCYILRAFGGIAQLARAPALQAGGQEFESLYLHHMKKNCALCSVLPTSVKTFRFDACFFSFHDQTQFALLWRIGRDFLWKDRKSK